MHQSYYYKGRPWAMNPRQGVTPDRWTPCHEAVCSGLTLHLLDLTPETPVGVTLQPLITGLWCDDIGSTPH